MKNNFKRYITIFLATVLFSFALTACNQTQKTYSVTITACENGKVVADKTEVAEGEEVSFSVKPDENYVLKILEIKERRICPKTASLLFAT